jgi:decaprenylphospho-beta-D-erythro-pentofuranosid-2-ulose 2-reductase
MRRIVIVGATSAIAEHCARIWGSGEPVDLTLVGRDSERLERVAADLRVRNATNAIEVVVTNFLDPVAIQRTVDSAAARGAVDIVLVAHGTLPNQAVVEESLTLSHAAIEINALSPVMFAEGFVNQMLRSGTGTLALISSVAGDRGRRSNYIYGASKALLSTFAAGLQHRAAGTNVKVVLIKPGPTDTPMTKDLKSGGARLAPVGDVASQIVRAIDRGTPVLYVPGIWRVIMFVIRAIPAAVFNRLRL